MDALGPFLLMVKSYFEHFRAPQQDGLPSSILLPMSIETQPASTAPFDIHTCTSCLNVAASTSTVTSPGWKEPKRVFIVSPAAPDVPPVTR